MKTEQKKIDMMSGYILHEVRQPLNNILLGIDLIYKCDISIQEALCGLIINLKHLNNAFLMNYNNENKNTEVTNG